MRPMELSDLAVTILRVWIGLVMVIHGVNHGRSLGGTARWFGRMGWRAPRYQAWLSSVAEIAVGAGLVLGLATTPAAAGAVAVMLTAYWTEHRRNGFFIFNKGQGYEYVITLAAGGAAVALQGAGAWSVDGLVGIEPSGAWRIGILVAALVLGALHVAAFWRPAR